MPKKTFIALTYSILIFIYLRLVSNNSVFDTFMPFIILIIGATFNKEKLKLKKYGFVNSLVLLLILAGFYFYKSSNSLAYLTINELSDQILVSIIVFVFFNYFVYE